MEPNDDAAELTFTVRDGLSFSDGTPVLPSSFQRGWETASDPDFAGDYSYLFSFIEGGQEKLDGAADTISGVEVDDDAMTITVTLVGAVRQLPRRDRLPQFVPMPEAVDELRDQNEWENGLMIGNGPFMMDAPRNDQEIVARAQPRVGRHPVRRGTRPAGAAVPRQAHVPGLGRRRHRVQRLRGR